ncbi:unnamed protein product [Adineta ricciae]|uniref:Uncharacterized protein n=1 Tax=Adineta ricciae TaxID=249248 RepID=A0A815EGE2_ADIRI|nr:unnamed protein product [Adineta ricciae]
MTRDITQANGLLSARQTNYHMKLRTYPGDIEVYPQWYNSCKCDHAMRCTSKVQFHRVEDRSVPSYASGLLAGCYTTEATLQSTLECFYNQSCVTQILSYLHGEQPTNDMSLNASSPSRFLVNSTLEQLLSELMIEQWAVTPIYEKYYSECQPKQCTYTYKTKNAVIFIMTAIVGLVGGLKNDVNTVQTNSFSQISNKLWKLNLFASVPPSTNENDLRNERMSTRIFIFVFVLSLITILFYYSLINVTITVTREHPSFNEYRQLYEMHHHTLTCPCTKVSTNYKEFLQVTYTLHQMCSSVLITDEWFEYLSYRSDDNQVHSDDFRWIGQALFQSFHTVCNMAKQTISDSLSQFYSNQYITTSVTSFELFTLQTKSSLDQFMSIGKTNLFLALDLIQNTTGANYLLSARKTNYYFYHRYYTFDYVLKDSNETCTDPIERNFKKPVSIFAYPNHTTLLEIPGLLTGCYVIDAALQSTLECFYNQSCVTQILSYLHGEPPTNDMSLNASSPSRFLVNSTLEQLLSELMIEQWAVAPTYEKYYSECQPKQCTFTYKKKNDVIFIMTAIVGLVGGLSTILRLIVPILVKFIAGKLVLRRQQHQDEGINSQPRSTVYLTKILHFIYNFNMFPSVPPSTDENDLRDERLSTRLFIPLFILSLITILFYYSLINVTITVTRENPSLSEYRQLYEEHSQTLTCPCTKVSTNYKEFLQVTYTLHQVCSSDFVTEEWLTYLARTYLYQNIYKDDFLYLGSSTFQALDTLCQMVNRSISNRLNEFYSHEYLSAIVTSPEIFLSTFESLLSQLRPLTTSSFLLSFEIIQRTTANNVIMSAFLSNYQFIGSLDLNIYPVSHSTCTCHETVKCVIPYPVQSHPMIAAPFSISHFFYGCYVIEALLQSSLTCFYDKTCISEIQKYITYTSPFNVTVLDSSSPSKYSVDATIQDILDQLMIEQWNQSIKYDKYYNHCQPKQCTYMYEATNNVVSIITILFGLVGGLLTVLRLIVPLLVKIIAWMTRRCRRITVQDMPTIGT